MRCNFLDLPPNLLQLCFPSHHTVQRLKIMNCVDHLCEIPGQMPLFSAPSKKFTIGATGNIKLETKWDIVKQRVKLDSSNSDASFVFIIYNLRRTFSHLESAVANVVVCRFSLLLHIFAALLYKSLHKRKMLSSRKNGCDKKRLQEKINLRLKSDYLWSIEKKTLTEYCVTFDS